MSLIFSWNFILKVTPTRIHFQKKMFFHAWKTQWHKKNLRVASFEKAMAFENASFQFQRKTFDLFTLKRHTKSPPDCFQLVKTFAKTSIFSYETFTKELCSTIGRGNLIYKLKKYVCRYWLRPINMTLYANKYHMITWHRGMVLWELYPNYQCKKEPISTFLQKDHSS